VKSKLQYKVPSGNPYFLQSAAVIAKGKKGEKKKQ
jgi:hypothetical protein